MERIPPRTVNKKLKRCTLQPIRYPSKAYCLSMVMPGPFSVNAVERCYNERNSHLDSRMARSRRIRYTTTWIESLVTSRNGMHYLQLCLDRRRLTMSRDCYDDTSKPACTAESEPTPGPEKPRCS